MADCTSLSAPMPFILLISSSAVCAAVVRLLLLLRRNLHSGRKLELSAGDNTFARLNALRNHGHVAILFLSRLYLTQIERRVGFHDKNVWPVLSDLHGTARH